MLAPYRKITYLIASFWSYPFGGGEEYLYQTAVWMKKLGAQCYWISFADSQNNNYDKLIIGDEKDFISIKVPGGIDSSKLIYWMKLIKPSVVHHQGHHHEIFYAACQSLRIEYITGIH